MYKVNILEKNGKLDIELAEDGSGENRDIVYSEELDNVMAAKKRYHMLRTFDEGTLRSLIKHQNGRNDTGESLKDLDRILGRTRKIGVTMHKI